MNQVRLSARIAQAGTLRHTPAGLPALDLELEHESTIEQLGQARQVRLVLRALALGTLAERLATQAIGSNGCYSGFLAAPRRGRQVVLHIQDFQQDQ
ncbi:MAG TPA: primosomal replication protein N [Ottowia sp.]|uniref:primosomal replication protein N n=1 Tax=Ottowia sp. TaxID=1898956 RepID=UPI002BC93652|nr:primosomal replication protein N [Ottowia sp.]HMN21466.1 primosomal replication protein N [Ottowia sp.]